MSSVWAPAESRAPAPIENQTVSVRSQAVRLTAAAERRGEHAYTRAQNAVDRADRPKERARGARRPCIAAEPERGRAEPALDLERGQLEKDLAASQRRVEVAEKARDASIRVTGSTRIGSRTREQNQATLARLGLTGDFWSRNAGPVPVIRLIWT